MIVQIKRILVFAISIEFHSKVVASYLTNDIDSESTSTTNGIRLCCEFGSSFYPKNSCQPIPPTTNSTHTTQQTFHRTVFDEFDKVTEHVDLLRVFEYVTGVPDCKDLIMIPLEHSWNLYWNGTIRYRNVLFNESSYCLSPGFLRNQSRVVFPVYVCKAQLVYRDGSATPYVAYCMLTSIPFLVGTFIVYASLPELRNVHGKSLMCYLCGLAGTFTGMVLIQMEYGAKEYVCQLLGPATYFLIMFSFFWLNVISFDVWWNFRGTGKLRPNTKSSELRKFRLFSIYAWLSSLVMVMCSVIVEVSPIFPDTIRPGYLMGSCFLKKSTLSEFLYLYLPIVLIMSCNATFFLLTAQKIRRLQREIGMVTGSVDSGRHQKRLSNEQEQFGLFGRLYIVMGVTWVLDVVSWTLDDSIELMYLCDVWNALQGPIIFALFVLKANVRKTIWKKCRSFRGHDSEQIAKSSKSSTQSNMSS